MVQLSKVDRTASPPDIHIPQNPDDLRFQTRSLAAMLLACGLDPEKCTLFIQSHVTAHAGAQEVQP